MDQRRKKQSGFTLFETMIALGIMSLLMVGFMNMFINSLRMATRANAEVGASQDAAYATRAIIEQTREAWEVFLPGDSNDKFTNPASETSIACFEDAANTYFGTQSLSSFQTQDSDGNTIDTAICIVSPATNPSVSFDNSSGGTTSLSNLYNRDLQGGFIMIYRADYGGTPDSANGTYLYQASAPVSTTAPTEIIPLCQHAVGNPSAAAGPMPPANAVQFVHPTDSSGNELKNEVETKIVSTYYSPINGQQTSETTNATLDTSLTGKCVFLRDYNTAAAAGATTYKSGSRFTPTN